MNSVSFIANKLGKAMKDHPISPDAVVVKKQSEQRAQQHQSQQQHQQPSKTWSKDLTEEKEPRSSHVTTMTKSKGSKLLDILLFIPNMLLIRPILFTWFIITFPLSLLEQNKSGEPKPNDNDNDDDNNNDNDNDNNDDEENDDDDEENENDGSGKNSKLNANNGNLKPSANETIPELDEEIDSISNSEKANITVSEDLKSPTSPTSSNLLSSRSNFFIFPKFVFPKNLTSIENYKKTLILDLDETLVHSLSRGSRMPNGHMIEVKFNSQIATLYSVHKRPYCDFFLKQVSKWFNLVIFTASVKEYADPVIDWLECERKFFNNRYYRNHCTLRDGQGYIKDLSTVEKNLNDVIIIDNSPISYAKHENNAIIVEGWINDPTDTDLLNLIPLLDGLRYATDVRAVLSLKNGEVAFEK